MKKLLGLLAILSSALLSVHNAQAASSVGVKVPSEQVEWVCRSMYFIMRRLLSEIHSGYIVAQSILSVRRKLISGKIF